MGELPGHFRNSVGINTILPADIYDVPTQTRRQPEHTHDADTNTRQLRLGGKSRSTSWERGVEYMGSVSCHWMLTRHLARHGDRLRAARTAARKSRRDARRRRRARWAGPGGGFRFGRNATAPVWRVVYTSNLCLQIKAYYSSQPPPPQRHVPSHPPSQSSPPTPYPSSPASQAARSHSAT